MTGPGMLGPALDRPVFVVGLPRSGTTLFRYVLSRSDLHVIPETHFLSTWLQRFPALAHGDGSAFDAFWLEFTTSRDGRVLEVPPDELHNRLLATDRCARTIFATIMAASAEAAGKHRVGEKTPAHYAHVDTLLNWFPDARVLWITRDPRAVVASWHSRSDDWTNYPTAHIARRWLAASAALDAWGGDERVHELRYETFVRDPDHHLPAVLGFLELDGHAKAWRSDDRAHGGYRVGWGYDPKGAITTNSVERWRELLSASDVGVIEHIAGAAMEARGMTRSLSRRAAAVAYGRQRFTAAADRLRQRGGRR